MKRKISAMNRVNLKIIVLLLLLLPMADFSNASIKVIVKNSSGNAKEIPLYTGYHALVIGCSNYTSGWPPLPNPIRDASEVSELLKRKGWRVELLLNPDSRRLKSSLNQLVAGPGQRRDHAILIWFSGHGHTITEADGFSLGYLVPVDAPDPDENLGGFIDAAVSMRYIETVSKQIFAKHVLMVFDSCFSGSIFQLVRAKPKRTPFIDAKVSSPVRQFITAGTEKEMVPDKSVFKDVFLQAVGRGYADVNKDHYVTGEELGSYLQERVSKYTHDAQHPQYGKINNPKLDKGDFVIETFTPVDIENKKAQLFVKTYPQTATIKILNIDENFFQGILLEPGRYQIEASIAGWKATSKWIDLKHSEIKRVNLSLTKPDAKNFWEEPRTNMAFIPIPKGCFKMGCVSKNDACEEDEKPVHEVCLDGFWMGKYEVTLSQFRQFIAATGYKTDAERNAGDKSGCWTQIEAYGKRYWDWQRAANWRNPGYPQSEEMPVVCVSWDDTKAFTNWLNSESEYSFRLPTEAEWEYASRAGSMSSRFWGDDPEKACQYANVADRTKDGDWTQGSGIHKCTDGFYHAAPVGSFKSNGFGLNDTLGNVWEWCEDIYADDAYIKHTVRNPNYQGEGSERVIRGGCRTVKPEFVRSAHRNSCPEKWRYGNVGFRLIRD